MVPSVQPLSPKSSLLSCDRCDRPMQTCSPLAVVLSKDRHHAPGYSDNPGKQPASAGSSTPHSPTSLSTHTKTTAIRRNSVERREMEMASRVCGSLR